uniref:Putative secreted protein n=1 Tax=Anopheles darlingi TaxID=43151 RepID=A0A2M4D8U7_ANODA
MARAHDNKAKATVLLVLVLVLVRDNTNSSWKSLEVSEVVRAAAAVAAVRAPSTPLATVLSIARKMDPVDGLRTRAPSIGSTVRMVASVPTRSVSRSARKAVTPQAPAAALEAAAPTATRNTSTEVRPAGSWPRRALPVDRVYRLLALAPPAFRRRRGVAGAA